MPDPIEHLLGRNGLLKRLRVHDVDLLKPHLRRLEVPGNTVLYDPGHNVQTVYFPCAQTTVAFMVAADGGHVIETTQVGREGAVGGIVSQGACRPSPGSWCSTAARCSPCPCQPSMRRRHRRAR